jgi:hypothetical protein
MSPKGEKRAGGRPQRDPGNPRITMSASVHPKTLIEIDTRALAGNKSRGEVIDDAFKVEGFKDANS